MKDLAEMTYSEFSEYFDEHDDDFEIVLDYDNFIVYYEVKNYRFFFYETGENDVNEFYELELVASLSYKPENEPSASDLISLIPNTDCCGEPQNLPKIGDYPKDSCYYWFKKKEINKN